VPYQINPDVFSGTVLSFVEISELVNSRFDLAENDRKFKTVQDLIDIAENEKDLILENIDDPIIHLDLERRIKWLNPAAAAAIGEPPEELTGRQCHSVWCPTEKECTTCPAQQAIDSQQPAKGAVIDSCGREWSIKASPVLTSTGRMVGVVEMRWLME
jgi:PAS domain S-box-containing protein